MLQNIPWVELLEAIFRQRRTAVTVALIVIGLSLLMIWLTPPSYRAAARIQLSADPESMPRGEAMSDKQLQAELAFLRSPVLISRVLTELGDNQGEEEPPAGLQGLLRQTWKKVTGSLPVSGSTPEAQTLERRVLAAAENIEVAPIGRSNVVEIAYPSLSPAFAADFVNGLLNEHVERITELSRESRELPFIQSQLDFLVNRWQEARQALDAFRSNYGTSVLDGDEGQLRGLLSGLEAQRVAAETNVLELRARARYLEEQKLEYPTTIESELRMAEPEAVKLLETRITELQMQKSEALTRYTPTSVTVRQLERQIEAAQDLLDSKEKETFFESATARNPAFAAIEVEELETTAQLRSAEARVEALSGQIASYRGKLAHLAVAIVELDRLQNEVESAQEAYQTYLREAETARKATARDDFGMMNIAVIEPAKPPRLPEPSRAKIKGAMQGLLGILLGLVAALLRDWLDPSLKSAAQARRLTGLQVLAEIPYQ